MAYEEQVAACRQFRPAYCCQASVRESGRSRSIVSYIGLKHFGAEGVRHVRPGASILGYESFWTRKSARFGVCVISQ